MKLWMRKIFVAIIAVMTLGLYIPPITVNTNAQSNEIDQSKTDISQAAIPTIQEDKYDIDFSEQEETKEEEQYADVLAQKAKDLTITKLGPRIVNQVEVDFTTVILPNIETVIKRLVDEAGEGAVEYLAITEQPTQGYGERIFNIYDYRSNQAIAKFHVRRDNRPMEGYWFNFHYHLSKDGFEKHHQIGEIYWDKNTPPKWMA